MKSLKFLSGIIVGIVIVIVLGVGGLFSWQRRAQLSGNVVSEQREVSGFNKVSVSGSGLVLIEQTGEESLKIETDENLMKYIETKVSNNELQVKVVYRGLFKIFAWPQADIKYYLTVKDLEMVNLNGSVKLESPKIATSKLEININGSGDARASLEVEKLATKVSGSGAFTLSGVADYQTIVFSGSGKFFGKELLGKEAEIRINGSGKAELNVSEKLSVDVSGSGTIRYLGDPEIVQNISGSGKIEKLED
ncbi:head GIN domain-containing protein [Patescibacteria group bacterium]